MFTCQLCNKKWKTSQELDFHTVTHTKEKPHKCPKCSAEFGRISSVQQHVRMVHDGIKKVPNRTSHCHMCSYKCYNKTMLRDHLRKHFAERPFSCTILGCKFKTKYKTNLLQHASTAHNDEKPFECQSHGCSYKTKTSGQLKKHLRIHSNEKPFACEFPGCHYKCKSNESLKVHTIGAHIDKKPFVCLTCGFRSKTRGNLMQHQNVQQRLNAFNVKSQTVAMPATSGEIFSSTLNACTERRIFYALNPVAVPGMATWPYSLRRHLKSHGKILNCPRGSCNFSTRFKHSFLKHMTLYHVDLHSITVAVPRISDLKATATATGTIATLFCSFPNCGYQTKYQRTYERHRISHNEEEKKQHVCSFCFSRFRHLCTLKAHVQRHVGEKPYIFSYCKYAFVSSVELSQHARRSHQIRVIPRGQDEVRKCRTCGMNCLSYNEFVLHSISHLRPVVVLKRLYLHVMRNICSIPHESRCSM